MSSFANTFSKDLQLLAENSDCSINGENFLVKTIKVPKKHNKVLTTRKAKKGKKLQDTFFVIVIGLLCRDPILGIQKWKMRRKMPLEAEFKERSQ